MIRRWPIYGVLLGGLIVLSLLVWRGVEQGRETELLASRYDTAVAWPLTQARLELERFRAALGRHVAGDPEVSYADVLMRFDIYWSRIPLLDTEVVLEIDVHGLTLDEVKAGAERVLQTLDPTLQGREHARGDKALLTAVNALIEPQASQLHSLLVEFQVQRHHLYEQTRGGIIQMSRRQHWVMAGFLGLTLVLLAISLGDARAARRAEARFRQFADSASDWLWELDAARQLTYVSPGWQKSLGYEPTGPEGPGWTRLIEESMKAVDALKLECLIDGGRAFRDCICEIRSGTGEIRTIELSGVPVHGRRGKVIGYRGTATDVTEKLRQERRIRYLAEHDAVTGLRNRAALLSCLEDVLQGPAERPLRVALLALDLDGFKTVNDSFGHDVGDRLLVEVGRRLEASVRGADIVARSGGDEFAILLREGPAPGGAAETAAERIIEQLASPFEIDGQLIQVGTSIGIAIYPDHVQSSAPLLKAADMALYRAKQEGRSCYRVYTDSMGDQLRRKREVERALRLALERDEISVHYQPLFRLSDLSTVSVEALARWQHPEWGTVPPADFIPVAEETGLIIPLGYHVLAKACRVAVSWRGSFKDVGVAVNVSMAQLVHSDFAEDVREILEAAGLEPERLTLEITESMLMRDQGRVIDILTAIRRLGVQLAIDDFGTGYSSLAHLRCFPVTKLKLDRSFMTRIGTNEGDRHIVKGMIAMAHSLGLVTVAEGIETDDQLRCLVGLGCEEVQGFLLGRPVSAERLFETPQAARPARVRAPAELALTP